MSIMPHQELSGKAKQNISCITVCLCPSEYVYSLMTSIFLEFIYPFRFLVQEQKLSICGFCFTTRAVKGEAFSLKFWCGASFPCVTSRYFVISLAVHLGGSAGVCFRSPRQQNFPVIHLVWMVAEVVGEQRIYILCNISRL